MVLIFFNRHGLVDYIATFWMSGLALSHYLSLGTYKLTPFLSMIKNKHNYAVMDIELGQQKLSEVMETSW